MNLNSLHKHFKIIEVIMLLLLVGIIIFFHAELLHYGKGLWRDEASSAQLARNSFVTGTHLDLLYDSFPPVSTIIFHAWTLISGSDWSLRILGCLIGLAIVVVIFLDSYLMGLGWPLLALAIFEINPTVIRYGDEIRPYGLGVMFILLTLGLIWKFLKSNFSWKLFIITTISAVLAVQTMYQNTILLSSIAVGAIIVALSHRDWNKIYQIVAIGIIAGISLIPYLGFIRHAADWSTIAKYPLSIGAIWPAINDFLGNTELIFLLVAGLICIAGCSYYFYQKFSEEQADLFLFSIMTLVVSTILFVGYLIIVQVPPEVWYFVPLFAVICICLQGVFKSYGNINQQRLFGVLAVVVFLILNFQSTYQFLQNRITNIDLIANFLATRATSKDLVVVNTWQNGVSFNRYYQGPTPWTTLPYFSDIKIFRYDIMKNEMSQPDPTKVTLDQIQATLRSGANVYIVGDTSRAPNPTLSTNMNAYLDYWTQIMNKFLYTQAQSSQIINLATNQSVNRLEDLSVTVFHGWK